MLRQAKRKGAILAAVLATALGLGAATPALAEDSVDTYTPQDAKLTKVIDAPIGTDATSDMFTFRFAGGGEAHDGIAENGEDPDHLYSDGVEQDAMMLKTGDVVPAIADVQIGGVSISEANSLSNGQVGQSIAQKSIEEIVNGITWPHAGVYTYVVTEGPASTSINEYYVNSSKAEYTLRIRVANAKIGNQSELGNTELVVDSVTVEQTKDDNGNALYPSEKVDPTYPRKDSATDKIVETPRGAPEPNKLAGDVRGRDVDGFTFANEYIHGGQFVVKKLYDGKLSDRTEYSPVELAIYSEAAKNPDAHGACVTYQIDGDGRDTTEYNQDSYGEHMRLNGVYDIDQVNDRMATFNDNGWCYIKADLKEGGLIRITGEFGPYNPEYEDSAPNKKDRRMTLSTNGLLDGQTFYVIEAYPGNYVPTGYVYVGGDASADPRKDQTNMTKTEKLTSDMVDETSIPGPEYDNNPDAFERRMLKAGSLFVKGSATGGATTVFVVNAIDESNVNPTGIFIDNLPYILMVGIPVAVFAVMFVIKHRENAAA